MSPGEAVHRRPRSTPAAWSTGIAVIVLSLGLGAGAALAPVLVLFAVAGAALMLVVLLRPYATLLVLVAALPWEGLLAYPSEAVSAVKILGLLLAVSFFLQALGRGTPLRASPIFAPVALFGLLVGVSLLASGEPVEGVFKALSYLLFIAFLFFVVQLVADRGAVRTLLRVFTLSAAAAALYALVGFLGEGELRAAGPLVDPNDFAFLLATALPPAGYLIVYDRRARPLWCLAFLLLVGAILATFSRGALAGLAALVLWAIAARRIPITGLIAAGAAALLVLVSAFALFPVLLDERLDSKSAIADQNVQSRQAFWEAALRMAADHPALGVGPGRFGAESADYIRDNPLVLPDPVAHQAYLEILAESGLPALLAFLAFLATTWRLLAVSHGRMRARGDPEGAALVSALQASFVVSVVCNLFLSQQLATPFWLVAGLAAVVAHMSGTSADVARAPAPRSSPVMLRRRHGRERRAGRLPAPGPSRR